MLRSSILILTALVLFTGIDTAQGQISDWADKDLQVRDSLQLWIDASRINESRATANLPPLESGEAVATWNNATTKRMLEQPDVKSQPKLVKIGDAWVMRFDGEDDHFRLAKTGLKLDVATVIVVVAPHANP